MGPSRLASLGFFYVLLGVSITCTWLSFSVWSPVHVEMLPGQMGQFARSAPWPLIVFTPGDQHWFKCSSSYHSVRLFGLGNWAPWTLVPRRHPSWSFSTARAGEAEQRNSSQSQWTERHNWLWRMAPTIPGSFRAWLHSNDKRSCLPHWASVWAENVGMIIWTEMITIALINMKQTAI